jgi:hypothetical protein
LPARPAASLPAGPPPLESFAPLGASPTFEPLAAIIRPVRCRGLPQLDRLQRRRLGRPQQQRHCPDDRCAGDEANDEQRGDAPAHDAAAHESALMITAADPAHTGRNLRPRGEAAMRVTLEASHLRLTPTSSPAPSIAAMESWEFAEGDEIVPGRRAVRLLGGGHRYEAWLAWDQHLRALVVAKLLRPDQAGDPAGRRALEAEARMLSVLAHPLLVRSFGAEPAGDRPHLVLELVEGPRLSTLIRRYGLILEQVLPLALNLSSVLHYLAEERVVHLDVKPRNIIMAGSPRLIDLSVARSLDELGALRGHVGTDAYMAPEQCDPERWGEIGSPSDVWGLGVTVHEGITGALPYPWPSPALAHPQLVHDLVLGDRVPAVLRAPLRSCLELRPADRPTAAELGDALEPLADALPPPRIGRFRPGGKQLLERLEAS